MAGCPQAVQISVTMVVEIASGIINVRNSAHDFSVKLSSWM